MRTGFPAAFMALTGLLLFAVPADAAIAKGATPASVEWGSGDTVYLAGRDVTVDSNVAGALTITGETVAITRDVKVGGDVWIAGRRVATEGDIKGDLSIRAQDALINGHVKGDVTFYGVHVVFGPDAWVEGNVNYFSAGPAEVDTGARIKGAMRSKVWDEATKPREPHYDGSEPYRPYTERNWSDRWPAPGYRLSWPGAIFFGLLAGIVALAAPAGAARLSEAAGAQPAFAFLVGLVWLIGTPILAVISAVTIIGLPLAFIVILLWPLGMVIGLVIAIMAIGELVAGRIGTTYDRTARVIGGIVVATLLLWIGISLPALGGFVWLAAVTFGVGALVLSVRLD
ncbi:MAG: polymer-forming cytoskeletal protein [Parvibaculum sedimenti]|uniref:hypothetical protein n=1 Tax=Parvibaculum sedimenti TaxID=2608632 RepID=UPI003BB752E2